MSLQQGELDLRDLRDRFAIITGAGNYGIGWGLARHAAIELDMHVVLIDLYSSTVDSAAKELQALAPSRRVIPIACDVTDEASECCDDFSSPRCSTSESRLFIS